MSEKKQTIGIIGAGLGGMSAAYDLVKAGHSVVIYESGDHVGGLAAGFKEPHWDWSVEKFYHHWFQSDQHLLGLAEETGLREGIFFPRPYTVMNYKDKWYPFDSILAALAFPGLGFGINKVRFGLVGLYLRFSNNWQALEKHTVDDWMRKWAGAKAYETMWKPLVVGKFGPYFKEVNMSWFWARLKARTTRLGTYTGGFQKFCDDLAEVLRGQGVQIHLNASVQQITAGPGGGVAISLDGKAEPVVYDKVLSTTSPGVLAKMTPDLPANYLAGLRSLKHMGAVVMVFSLNHAISEEGYYWFNIPKEAGYPFLAMVEHTNFVPREHFGGDHILYCGDYLPTDHAYFTADKETVLADYIPGIKRVNPNFEESWINKTWLFRTQYAQPVPLVNHSQNIPAIQTPVDGLFFASMSQVYPWDRGTNFAVEIGRKAAKMMLAQNQ